MLQVLQAVNQLPWQLGKQLKEAWEECIFSVTIDTSNHRIIQTFWIYICYSSLTKSNLSSPWLSLRKHELCQDHLKTSKTFKSWIFWMQMVTLILILGDNNQAEMDLTYLR